MKSELFQELISRDSLFVPHRTRTGRDVTRRISSKQMKETIICLDKMSSKIYSNNLPKLVRQVGNKQISEAIVVNTPNVDISLVFGSKKFVDQLLQAYFIFDKYPDLEALMILDNKNFIEQVYQRTGRLKQVSALRRANELLYRILLLLSQIGPRALGGRIRMQDSFKSLRLSFRSPKKPKAKVFRRGYNDKGSTASDTTTNLRTVSKEYQSIVDIISSLLKPILYYVDYLEFGESLRTITYSTKNGFEIDEVNEVLREHYFSNLEKMSQLVSINSLTEKEVVKAINLELRRD